MQTAEIEQGLPPDPLLDKDEMAAYLSQIGIDVVGSTVSRWERLGEIPSVRISSRRIRYSRPSVLSALGIADD